MEVGLGREIMRCAEEYGSGVLGKLGICWLAVPIAMDLGTGSVGRETGRE